MGNALKVVANGCSFTQERHFDQKDRWTLTNHLNTFIIREHYGKQSR